MIKGILTAKDAVKHNICASYSYMCQDYHGGRQLGYTVSSSLHKCHWDFVAMPCMYVKILNLYTLSTLHVNLAMHVLVLL